MNKDPALRTTLDLPYEQAVEWVVTESKKEGFGVLTEIDVQATLKKNWALISASTLSWVPVTRHSPTGL